MKLFIALLALFGFSHTATAQTISCTFTKECWAGERCTKSDYTADFVKHDDKDIYAVIADAGLAATGVFATHDGKFGSLVAKSAFAISPYEDIYVLSYSTAGSVLSITIPDDEARPDVVVYIGKCRRSE